MDVGHVTVRPRIILMTDGHVSTKNTLTGPDVTATDPEVNFGPLITELRI